MISDHESQFENFRIDKSKDKIKKQYPKYNPKKKSKIVAPNVIWTDQDMFCAFLQGVNEGDNFDNWLEKYKKKK